MYKTASRQHGGHAQNRQRGLLHMAQTQAEYIAGRMLEKNSSPDPLESLRRQKAKISLRKFSFDESEHAYRDAERKL